MGFFGTLAKMKFFNSTINGYINSRKYGTLPVDAMAGQLALHLSGSQNNPLPREARQILTEFDIMHCVQFLLYFSDRVRVKVEDVPKGQGGRTRQELLSILFPNQSQFFLNNGELLNTFEDQYYNFDQLAEIIQEHYHIY